MIFSGRRRTLALPTIAAALVLLGPPGVYGAATLRYQSDQRGDMVLFGNTVGWDCRPGVPRPVVGTIGACGNLVASSEIDVLWRADDPADGQARADRAISPDQARSTALLSLPADAVVTYARIYWAAGRLRGALPGAAVLVERTGKFGQTVAADASSVIQSDGPGMFYQSSADITELVQAQGPGAYRIGAIEAVSPVDLGRINFTAWSVVVFYKRAADAPRTLTLIDGLERVDAATEVGATISSFVPTNAGFSARLGVIAYEGDDNAAGDSIRFNGTTLTDPQNPGDNFFNGTRGLLGVPVSVMGDLPQLTGAPGSGNGLDLDIIDVTPLIRAPATSATILASTSEDVYYLGAFVGSVATLKPVFTDTDLTYANLSNPGGAIRPGDRVEFTLATRNTGSDTSTGTVVTSLLPVGVTYVPGSLRILAGPGAGRKSDAAADDQGEYDAMTRTILVRIGKGATGQAGGSIAVGDPATIFKYQVTIDEASKDREVRSQAVLTAAGVVGAMQMVPPATWRSGNGILPNHPTIFVVSECLTNADCSHRTPICDTTGPTPRCTNNCRDSSTCRLAPTGTRCLPSGLCGCQADLDCLSKMCDPATSTCVLQQADLVLTVRTDPNPPVADLPVTHILTVTNRGPGTAPGVTILYAVPEGSRVRGIEPGEGWECKQEGNTITCSRAAPLPPGAAPDIRIIIDPPPGAVAVDVNARVRVVGAIDPEPSNDVVARTDVISKDYLQLAGGGLSCALSRPDDDRARGAALLLSLAFLLVTWGRRRRSQVP